MSEEKVYTDTSRKDGIWLVRYNEEGSERLDSLHSIINAQNERIAVLEALVAGLVAKSLNTFGGQPI